MTNQPRFSETWEQTLFRVLRNSAGKAYPLCVLYPAVRKARITAGLPVSPTFEATIRRTLQQSPRFAWVRRGVWALAPTTTS